MSLFFLFFKQKVCWRNWMANVANVAITPETKFSDIIVPTIDTVRSAKIIEMLTSIKKPVSFIHKDIFR